jgi:hypothetical protein
MHVCASDGITALSNFARPSLLAAGDQLWIDRFMAQHAAIVYYIILVALFVASPKLAYNFSELIEAHAVDTYGEFADANEELLKTLPPPFVAVQYYLSGGIRRLLVLGDWLALQRMGACQRQGLWQSSGFHVPLHGCACGLR